MDDHWGSHLHTSHVATPKISNHSRTLTGQHQKRVEQFSKANAQSGMTMFGHRYSQKQAMTDAVSYLEELPYKSSGFGDYLDAVVDAQHKTVNMFKTVAGHPLQALENMGKGIAHTLTHPIDTYQSAVSSTTGFFEMFANANGAQRFGMALNSVADGIYGTAFTGGAGVIAGKGINRAWDFYRSARVPNSTHLMDPLEIRFSQTTVSGNKTRFDFATGRNVEYSYDQIVSSMKASGWKGDPLNVVRMPDGALTSIDNTRLLSARTAGIKAQIKIHEYEAALPQNLVKHFIVEGHPIPTTWGEAIHTRIGIQRGKYFQDRIFAEKFRHGSIYDPKVTGIKP